MVKIIHFPEVESANCVPAEDQIEDVIIAMEYRDAVACLYGIVKLSPRIAHRIMRKIIGVYRSLETISEGNLE